MDDYKKFLQTYQTEKPDVLLGVNWVDDPWYGAAVIVEKNNIVKEIMEKPPRGTIPSRWNNTGLFLFEPVIFEHLRQIKPSPRGEYELTAAIQSVIRAGGKVIAYKLCHPVIHLSTPEDLAQAQKKNK